MYRKTTKAKQYEKMREAKARKREQGPAPDYPVVLPKLRRIVIVIDYDFGKRVNIMKLYRTGRIDQYRAEANGKLWRDKIGFSGILAAIRKSFPPVLSF